MNVRKLLDWRKVLLYAHRWMGIVCGLLFIAWFFSGIVFTYRTMPEFGAAERLRHLPPIDLSAARVGPMVAAARHGLEPTELRVALLQECAAGRPTGAILRG